MSFISRLAKWKANWAIVSGLFSLIVIPFITWLLRDKKSGASTTSASSTATKKGIIDAEFEEIKK